MTTPTENECRWTGTQTPRALHNRHAEDCRDDRCRGCLPCPKRHCIQCGIEHVTQRVCPTCLGATRTDLAEIRRLWSGLAAHTVLGGNDGRLEAARPIPGGEATVMRAPGSHRGLAEYERESDHVPTAHLLATWEEDWRSVRHSPTTERAAVPTALAYLGEHLSWAAQHHDAYDAFATEVRLHRAHLEDVLHDGERTETGAPCEVCSRPLERTWGAKARDDAWWCERCRRVVRPAEYVENVARRARAHNRWLSARDMAEEHRIPVGTLQGWASKGLVRKRRDSNLGRMVYSVDEALNCRDRSGTQDVEVPGA